MQTEGTSYGFKMAAYQTVSDRIKVTEKTVRTWVKDFDMMMVVRESKRGKHSKTMSPIMNDPDFKAQFKEYVKSNSRKQGLYNIVQIVKLRCTTLYNPVQIVKLRCTTFYNTVQIVKLRCTTL